MAYPIPFIDKTAGPFVAETYRTSPYVMGQIDCNTTATNTALIVLVPHNRPHQVLDVYKLTGCRFNGIDMTLISTHAKNSNYASQPRIWAYVLVNPPKVVGDIDIKFDYETLAGVRTDVCATVHAFLLGNVNQTTPIGCINNTYVVTQDATVPFWMYFDAPLSLQTANGLILGAYYGSIKARNNIVLRGNTVQVFKGGLDFPSYPDNGDKMWFVGSQTYNTTGTKYFSYDQKTYGDDAVDLYFEVISSSPAPQVNLPDSVVLGNDPTVVFSNLTGSAPTTITLTDGTLTQTLPIVNQSGTLKLQLPTLLANKVKFGNCSVKFTDNGENVQADCVYVPGSLWYKTLTGAADAAVYAPWTTKPTTGDQIIYNNLLTDVDLSGNLAAYNAGTYTFYHLNGSTGLSSSYDVLFGDLVLPKIDPVGTTVTLQVDATCNVKIVANGFTPAALFIKDTLSKTGTRLDFTWNSGTGLMTYTCKRGAEAFNQPLSLQVIMNDGTVLETTVTITGFNQPTYTVQMPFKRLIKQRATKPYLNGAIPDDLV